MKPEELMISDWVFYNGKPIRICHLISNHSDLNDACKIENVNKKVKPIPITPEILEKNGFVKRSDRDDKLGKMEYYQLDDYGFVYHYSNGEWEFKLQNTQVYRLFIGYLNNVHELQHVLNILNIEKEIKL